MHGIPRGDHLGILRKISVEKWRTFIEEVPGANVYQTPEMLEAWTATRNYEPIVVGIEEDEVIKSIMLASVIREGTGLRGSFSSRAIVTGGPLSKEGYVKEQVRAFDSIATRKALFTEVRNLRDMSASRQDFEDLGYAYEGHLNYVHDLTRPLSEIWAGFSTNRKRMIRKAETGGIVVKEGDKADIDSFYELLSGTYENVRVPLADRSLFENVWRVMRPKDMARLFIATCKGETLAGRMILSYRGAIYDWYAGSNQAARDEKANPFLVWHILKWGIENRYKTFDFGGAGRPGENYGPGEFKRRFGGTPTNFGRFVKVYHSVRHFVGRKGYDLLRKLG